MFAGRFDATLDEKSRITVPAKFRLFLRSEEDRGGFFLTVEGAGNDRCLCLYPYSAWRRAVARVQDSAGATKEAGERLRRMLTQAEFAAVDKQGRLVVPREMAARAGLKKEIVLVGLLHWIEAWDPAAWKASSAAPAEAPDFRSHLLEPDRPSGGAP